MKDFILLLAVFAIVSCTKHQEEFMINGTTSDFTDSTMVYLSLDNKDIDSTLVIGNKFSFEGKVEDDFCNMWIHTKNYTDYKSIWVVNNEIKFDATNSSLRKAKVEGSRIQDQSNEYENVTAPFEVPMDSIRKLARTTISDSAKNKLRLQYGDLNVQKLESEVNFIRTNPEYELSAFFLTFLKNDIEKEITKELYEGLTDANKNSEWGISIHIHIEKSVLLEVGDKAIEFTLSTIDGEDVSLSDFRGKYVLLEFWATGCAPCRWENPNLLKAYRRFNDKGFEIFGVTLDEEKSDWESTIKKDSIIWTTVGDFRGMAGEVPITYSVNYIPKNYLLNEEGIVLRKDLRGKALQDELKRIFEE